MDQDSLLEDLNAGQRYYVRGYSSTACSHADQR